MSAEKVEALAKSLCGNHVCGDYDDEGERIEQDQCARCGAERVAALLVRAQEYIRLLPSRCLCEGLPRCARCEEDLAFLSDLDAALKGVERG